MNTAGEGKLKVWLKMMEVGEDLVLVLGGGERPHIGGSVMAIPGKEPIITGLEGHRDIDVLKPMAESACRKHGKTVIALGGLHVDNASKDEVQQMIINCEELSKCI